MRRKSPVTLEAAAVASDETNGVVVRFVDRVIVVCIVVIVGVIVAVVVGGGGGVVVVDVRFVVVAIATRQI